MTTARVLLLVTLLLTACGGKPAPVSSSQQELDRRHCTANTDCASGLCSNGRCG